LCHSGPLSIFDYDETLIINPVLILEVLSNDINHLRRTVKFREYKTLASLKEHILVDKVKCHIQLSYREEPNVWRITDHNDMSGSIYLKSIDCTIAISDIYENITFKIKENFLP
jgi:Uma2 family endonuclease